MRSAAVFPGKRSKPINVHIRCMLRCDMTEVRQIERRNFEFPWDAEDFIMCIRQRNCKGIVTEHNEQVVGYMVYEIYPDNIRILNLSVHPDWQRRRVGTAMIGQLINKLSHQGRYKIRLEVRETNLPAQKFFRAQGFLAISILPDFYRETTEDAYLMQFKHP